MPRKKEGFIEREVEKHLQSLHGSSASRKYSWKRKVRENKTKKMMGHAKLFHIRYGNLSLVIIGIIASIWLIYNPSFLSPLTTNPSLGFLGAFALGLLYPTGVTTPASIAGFFLLGKSLNPFLLAAVGAAGALITDFIIFYFIRHKLVDYLDKFTSKFTKTNMHMMRHKVNNHSHLKHLVPLFAGLLIASPLPTEIAIGIFAAIKFEMKKFLVYAFIFHMVSIFIVSQLGASYHLI